MPTFEITPDMMREIILDHASNPRHKTSPNDAGYLSMHSSSVNCIDDINVYLKEEGGLIKDAKWDGVACTISTASTDILCDMLVGKSDKEALYLIEQYTHMLHEEPYDADALEEALAFMNTSKQAARIHCASIGWDAVKELLEEHHHGE